VKKLGAKIIFIFLSIVPVFSQPLILAEKEIITTIKVGENKNEVAYGSSEEGFYSPTGPMVDQDGVLIFYPTTGYDRYKSYLAYSKKKELFRIPLFTIMEGWSGATQVQFTSQNGMIQIDDLFINPRIKGEGNAVYPQKVLKLPITYESRSYAIPSGAVMESIRPRYTYSTEVLPDRTLKVRDIAETRAWLPTQPGDFSIGDDGLLYRNGMLWSAILPSEPNPAGIKYIGRLLSGHTVWAGGGKSNMERFFGIANSNGQWELTLELPWAPLLEPRKYGYNPFNYGLGPWGEIYALIAPYWDEKTPWKPKDGDTSELVVVRNHLKYFGRLNDSGVRLRKEPNTTSDIVGTYPNKTGFRILETGTTKETIAGQTNVWYKVRLLDEKEGWFFGAFVHNLYDGPDGSPPPWPNVADW